MEIELSAILEKLEIIKFQGDNNTKVIEVIALGDGQIREESIFWCSNKYRDKLKNVTKGSVIISEETFTWLKTNGHNEDAINWIVVENPRAAFSRMLSTFFYKADTFGIISKSAYIHNSVVLDKNTVNIGENVVIEEGVIIGDDVKIGHNTVILAGTVIKNNVKIGSNTTIGGVGFGFEMDADGQYQVIPHIGNVVLDNGVEIGNGTTIDRAVLGSTLLMENVKVDNLVHIAHGVKIGKNSLVIANAMIAGSCEIGENVWVSPSASIIQKTKIGNDALVGIGSVVLKNVDESTIVAGVPAKKIRDK